MQKAALILTLNGALLALTACAGSDRSVPVTIDPAPASLTIECAGPVPLPVRDISQQEAEQLWRADRARHLTCASRHAGLVEWSDEMSRIATH